MLCSQEGRQFWAVVGCTMSKEAGGLCLYSASGTVHLLLLVGCMRIYLCNWVQAVVWSQWGVQDRAAAVDWLFADLGLQVSIMSSVLPRG